MTDNRVPPALHSVIEDGVLNALTAITEAQVPSDVIAEYRAPRRVLVWHTRPKFRQVGSGWRLGVFLIDDLGNLYATGDTTRGHQPNHPGHVSHERERRRSLTEAAFRSGFQHGEVVHFDVSPIDWRTAPLPPDGPLLVRDGAVWVRWSRNAANVEPREFSSYLREQLDLFLARNP